MAALNPAIEWGAVSNRASRVLIVGSGPSLRAMNLEILDRLAKHDIHIIAVNGSIEWVPVAHSWFSLDPSPEVRALMRKQRLASTHYAAVPNDYGLPDARVTSHRQPIEEGITFLKRAAGNGPLKARWGLSEDPRVIHTGNSLWGALGLAWLMNARRIAIIGLDGTRQPYAFGAGRPRGSFTHLPDLFASALPQLAQKSVEVFNGSPESRITAFHRMTPAAAINQLLL